MAVIPGYMKKERKGDNMSTCTLHGKLRRMIVCVECPHNEFSYSMKSKQYKRETYFREIF